MTVTPSTRPARALARPLPALVLTTLVGLAATLMATLGPVDAAAARAAQDGPPPTTVQVRPAADPVSALTSYLRLMAIPSLDQAPTPVSKAPRETGRTDCPPVRCEDHRLKVPSSVKVTSSKVRVLLPRGYHRPANRTKRYPVIFLWNGARSSYEGWAWKTELIAMSRPWQAIFVMPSGGQGNDAGMMSDWANGRYDWETFHTRYVVPWVDRTYRTTGRRGSVGASMGALGVFNYAAHNPGMFQAGLSISGSVDTTSMRLNTLGDDLGPLLGFAPPDLRKVWGDPVLDTANWDAHNPTMLADRLHGMKIFIASGTGFAGQGETEVHSGTFEQTMWTMHRTFLLALNAAKVPYTARVTVGGVHDWPYFNTPMRWGLPKMIAALTS
ncbi:alpha/beta hydrolase family protein [Nocardioides sp. R-C-SC26]|uniref:alpha/beta hydrolase n=1 Tax=Nocardioides sp. R-C-SC26 TaxID=2870414 RepID=UPI001E5869E6|nr:alpha/beta hydrolase-fold protein [Nocardioides sp. R-C-SC26]